VLQKKHAKTKHERDKSVILAALRRFGPLARVEIAHLTRLRANTISTLTRELLSEKHILEAGPSDNPVGRKQILLRLNEKRGFVLGIEFDAESVIAATMDLHPEIQSTVREHTRLDGGVTELVGQLFRCAREAISRGGLEGLPLRGIAIVDPGLVDARRGISLMSSQISFWKDVPLAQLFADEFGMTPVVETSARSRAVAERALGSGEMADDMIYVEYGAGVITHGRLLRGHDGCAAEFGHTHIIDGGPPCQCGSFGCLEAVAGSAALAARFRKVILDGGHSAALSESSEQVEPVTGWDILEAANAGDKTCSAITEEMGRQLGVGLANLVNLFNPSLIILDPRLKLAGANLIDQLTRVVRMQALSLAVENLKIRFGVLGSEAGVQGACLQIVESLFEIPALKPPWFLLDPAAAEESRRRLKNNSNGE